jgi:hypothetical protein
MRTDRADVFRAKLFHPPLFMVLSSMEIDTQVRGTPAPGINPNYLAPARSP